METTVSRSRLEIGLFLAFLFSSLVYLDAVRTTYTIMICFLLYDYTQTRKQLAEREVTLSNVHGDTFYLPPQKPSNYLFEFFWAYAFICNLMLVHLYQLRPSAVLFLIVITQLSDTLQYYIGRSFGRYKVIGISPNKTLEGYIGAYFCLWFFSFCYGCLFRASSSIALISLYFVLGALGGLVNSLVKRRLQLKEWSQLLGPHGGWIDRTDSLYLPALYLYLTNLF
jgi:CDP-diglyceride synthetase